MTEDESYMVLRFEMFLELIHGEQDYSDVARIGVEVLTGYKPHWCAIREHDLTIAGAYVTPSFAGTQKEADRNVNFLRGCGEHFKKMGRTVTEEVMGRDRYLVLHVDLPGHKLTTLELLDAMNKIGETVVSGARR